MLFFFKLPDVSRLFLLILFPTQFVLALGTRAALRLGFRWLRERGYNTRFVVIVGAGPRGQAFARRLAEHRELGLNVLGYVDDDPTFDLPAGSSLLGRLEDLPTILHERVVDEVAICLPFSQWNLVDAIARISEEEGKIVRVPMDVLDHAFAAGKMEDLDGTPVFSLVSGPGPHARPRRQAAGGRGERRRGPGPPEPARRCRGHHDQARGRPDPCSSASVASACTAGRSRWSSSAPWSRTRRTVARTCWRTTSSTDRSSR